MLLLSLEQWMVVCNFEAVGTKGFCSLGKCCVCTLWGAVVFYKAARRSCDKVFPEIQLLDKFGPLASRFLEC